MFPVDPVELGADVAVPEPLPVPCAEPAFVVLAWPDPEPVPEAAYKFLLNKFEYFPSPKNEQLT